MTVDKDCPEVIRALDLGRPALLEASAGTGKTFAIEHLVLRMLTELEVELGQILVLTFTEKATGELKERIRARLGRRMAAGGLPELALARLKEAYLNFDRASIFTIHGFCHRMLRNYAFENRAPFQAELAEDGEIYGKVLAEEMRSTWLSGGGGLPEFRRLAARLRMGPGEAWKDGLIRLARACNPFRGDLLLPEQDPERVRALEEEVSASLAALHGALEPALAEVQAAKFASPSRKKGALALLEEVKALSLAARGLADPAARLAACRDFFNVNRQKAAVKEGFAWLRPGASPATAAGASSSGTAAQATGIANPGVAGFLEPVIAAMDSMREALTALARERRALDFETQRQVIRTLRDAARDEKRLHGLMSFDDMVQDLCAALRTSPDLVAALRRQFRFCIVDEFQDTDPLQWEIFRTVFLSGEGHPLYLIGDPKQAIYGFRGGDIFTYLSARQDLFALSRQGKARGMSLDANFRSSQAMVAACNAVFAHKDWFRMGAALPGDPAWSLPPEADPLGFVAARHGGLPIQECRETPVSAPIILRDFTHIARKGPCQRGINKWVAAEIAALMARPDQLQIPDSGTGSRPGDFRPLDWADICVLVFTRREKRLLEGVFQRAGIPFQVHKRVGLYQSDAAGHFLALLESLEDPHDKGKLARALLTRFFRAPGDDPPGRLPAELPPHYEEWTRLAQAGEWQRLFRSLLYGTGLLYRQCLEGDGDRRVMDFLHLGQNLVQEALREALGLSALVQRLRELRAETPDFEEEKHLHREDSESRKVQIMTMHSAKGLEFPVVFLAGLSGSGAGDFLRYHAGGRAVFHLDTGHENAAALAGNEAREEERRLYYVALTRARYRLYLPVPPAAFGRSASPLGGFVAEAAREAARLHPSLFSWVQAGEAAEPAPRPVPAAAAAARLPLTDFPTEDPLSGPVADFSRRRRRLSSYSLLVRGAPVLAAEDAGRYDKEEAPAGEPASAPEAEPSAAVSAAAPGPPGNALPRGRETGNMFHEILEHVDFARVAASEAPEALLAHAPTLDILEARMREHGLAETHVGDVARVIWHALRAPLPDPSGGPPFRLGDTRDRRAEMEFLFPTGAAGYLGGFMDLVFRHQGRYYLLDWKSNWLEAYGTDAVAADIVASRYDVQYMLYSLALDKWLRSVLPAYDPARDFGGIYYLYIRGMRCDAPAADVPAHSPVPGVFALKPSPLQLREEFPALLQKAGAAVMEASS